jgi:spermidine/putrescine transport system ATP-binding protein
VQSGSPRELYDEPANKYVAEFVGKSNFLSGAKSNEVVSVRPELVEIASSRQYLPDGLEAQVDGRVLNRIFIGEQTEYRVASEALGEIVVMVPRKSERLRTFEIGDSVVIGWPADAALKLPVN